MCYADIPGICYGTETRDIGCGMIWYSSGLREALVITEVSTGN